MRRNSVLVFCLLIAPAAAADGIDASLGGHGKLTLTGRSLPADSAFRDLFGERTAAMLGEIRMNGRVRRAGVTIDADYQLLGLSSDRLETPGPADIAVGGLFGPFASDDRRLFDLTREISRGADTTLVHRLDRLVVTYTTERFVLRAGRQALTWGRGYFFAPMDIVNPFDPAAIDTEYKPGDDMLYAQALFDDGDDLQFALVARRDPQTGDAEYGESTAALKYHGFAGAYDFDLLAADVHGDATLGGGFGRALGGAQWNVDVVVTDSDGETVVQAVSNLAYSWVFADRNMTGVIEYYFNGFGQRAGRYSPAELESNPALVDRIARRELYTLGRHYLGATLTVELTPLLTLSPVVLANVGDPSGLIQLIANLSLSDNVVVIGSVDLPTGADGTEFGGIASGAPGRYLSSGAGAFFQVAGYF